MSDPATAPCNFPFSYEFVFLTVGTRVHLDSSHPALCSLPVGHANEHEYSIDLSRSHRVLLTVFWSPGKPSRVVERWLPSDGPSDDPQESHSALETFADGSYHYRGDDSDNFPTGKW